MIELDLTPQKLGRVKIIRVVVLLAVLLVLAFLFPREYGNAMNAQ